MDNHPWICNGSKGGKRRRMRDVFQILAIFAWLEISLAKDLPALFIFGDSLVDCGNNNFLQTLSKANYVPNGIDFGKPTGRYTNGRTIPDILGKCIYTYTYTYLS